MSSNHGGKRSGAGRPPRATNARTREIAERAFEEGVTPLEVMLDNMRFYHSGAEEAVRVGDVPTVPICQVFCFSGKKNRPISIVRRSFSDDLSPNCLDKTLIVPK
jgi:hypothetical protein